MDVGRVLSADAQVAADEERARAAGLVLDPAHLELHEVEIGILHEEGDVHPVSVIGVQERVDQVGRARVCVALPNLHPTDTVHGSSNYGLVVDVGAAYQRTTVANLNTPVNIHPKEYVYLSKVFVYIYLYKCGQLCGKHPIFVHKYQKTVWYFSCFTAFHNFYTAKRTENNLFVYNILYIVDKYVEKVTVLWITAVNFLFV